MRLGNTNMFLEKIFVLKYLQTIFPLLFTFNMHGKNFRENFLKTHFGHPYRSNGIKIRLYAALTTYTNTTSNFVIHGAFKNISLENDSKAADYKQNNYKE